MATVSGNGMVMHLQEIRRKGFQGIREMKNRRREREGKAGDKEEG